MEDMIKSNPQLTLSGLVPGILTNRLALWTCAPCQTEVTRNLRA